MTSPNKIGFVYLPHGMYLISIKSTPKVMEKGDPKRGP